VFIKRLRCFSAFSCNSCRSGAQSRGAALTVGVRGEGDMPGMVAHNFKCYFQCVFYL
jgi:hypothetical protein